MTRRSFFSLLAGCAVVRPGLPSGDVVTWRGVHYNKNLLYALGKINTRTFLEALMKAEQASLECAAVFRRIAANMSSS